MTLPAANFKTMTLDDLIASPFGITQVQKQAALLPLLQDLTRHHMAANPTYRRIVELTAPEFADATDYTGLPYLPGALFKFRSLRSILAADVRVTVQSSGTTGAMPSRIALDAANARLAARSLAAILATVTGGKRLPMLIIDSEAAVRGHDHIGARAAAILGLMPYGRDHVFALDDALQIVPERIAAFLAKHHGENILLFGFTFLVWQALFPACRKYGFDFTQATLLHSGGWKKLQSLAVDNAHFKQSLRDTSGMLTVTNFYGMAELPGTIFLEGADGLLHPPSFADIIIRDPRSFRPLLTEQEGLVQIVNAIAHSYPGHSILTEDMGVLSRADDGSIGLRITGRAPRAEMRGCSDVLAERVA